MCQDKRGDSFERRARFKCLNAAQGDSKSLYTIPCPGEISTMERNKAREEPSARPRGATFETQEVREVFPEVMSMQRWTEAREEQATGLSRERTARAKPKVQTGLGCGREQGEKTLVGLAGAQTVRSTAVALQCRANANTNANSNKLTNMK